MDHTNSSRNNIRPTPPPPPPPSPPMPYFSEFGLQECVDQDLNFDQIIEMIRGEAPDHNNPAISSFDSHNTSLITTTNLASTDSQLFCSAPNNINAHLSSFNNNNFNSPTSMSMSMSMSMSCTNNNTTLNSLSGIEDDVMKSGEYDDEDEDEDEEINNGEGENSSATTTTTTTNTTANAKKPKVDRSRTLISERRRRGRMKEKLYALRALVPNITKMDKASIVGDAVLYVQDLQAQAKKLKSQIEGLESSLKAAETYQLDGLTPKKNSSLNTFLPVCKIIMKIEVRQIEDREFYVKVVSNKGQGVAASMYKALENFTSFIIQNSNLNTVCERFVLTFTLNVAKCSEDLNEPNLRLWITGAFLNQGFEFQTL